MPTRSHRPRIAIQPAICSVVCYPESVAGIDHAALKAVGPPSGAEALVSEDPRSQGRIMLSVLRRCLGTDLRRDDGIERNVICGEGEPTAMVDSRDPMVSEVACVCRDTYTFGLNAVSYVLRGKDHWTSFEESEVMEEPRSCHSKPTEKGACE